MNKNLLLYAIGGFAIYYLLFRKKNVTTLEPQTEVPLDQTSSAPTPPMRGGVMEAQVIDLPSGSLPKYNQGIESVVPTTTPIIPKSKVKPKVFGLQVPRLGTQTFDNQTMSLPKILANRRPKVVYYGELERITPYEDSTRIVKYRHRMMNDIVISEIDENQNMVWYYEANHYPIKIVYPTR